VRRRLVLATLALAATGCGNERTAPPDVSRPDDPVGRRDVTLQGLRFQAPANWIDLAPHDTRAGGIQSKRATVAVWRYPRTEPLPRTSADLRAAAERLVERVRQRDPRFSLTSTSYRRRAGSRTIELVGEQTIAGRRRAVRSTHVFADGTEFVVDAIAPPEDFARLDTAVFVPLLRSLTLTRR